MKKDINEQERIINMLKGMLKGDINKEILTFSNKQKSLMDISSGKSSIAYKKATFFDVLKKKFTLRYFRLKWNYYKKEFYNFFNKKEKLSPIKRFQIDKDTTMSNTELLEKIKEYRSEYFKNLEKRK